MKTIHISTETLMEMIQETYLRIVKEQFSSAGRFGNGTNMLAEGEWRYIDVTATILKETQKAYQISVKYFTEKGLSVKEAKMWCPKSCCVVENGNVTKVADFVLNRWQQEHFDFLKSKGYKSSPICFDLNHLQNTVDKKKKEKDEYQTFYNEVLNKLVEDLTPIVDKNIKDTGTYSKMLGQYLLSKGLAPSDKCSNLITLGDMIINEFGSAENNWTVKFFNDNPSDEQLWNTTREFEDLFYGFPINDANRAVDYPKSFKYSAKTILEYELKLFRGYYGEGDKRKSKLYKLFKKYADYVSKFNEIAFDALNSMHKDA